ncbi:diguanylate cyclase domain-containing protein, partial [Pseudomonas sp. SIMBA_021]
IIDAITQDHPETEHGARVGATIGIALYPEHGRDLDALILNADMAMYHQKRMNRGQISFFSESLRSELERKRLLSEELLTALINNCFS